MIKSLPKAVETAREEANQAYVAYCIAWEHLDAIVDPPKDELEGWIAVKEELHQKQEAFESLLWSYLSAGLR